MKKLYLIIFLSICFSQTSYSQLSNFTLTVTKTDESCTGNASLSFNVTNTVPGSTIIYRIYKLPDIINAIAVTSANTFGGLTAGTYRVIATQTLGASSGTQQQDIIIQDIRTYVTYQVTGTTNTCTTGTITIGILSGSAVTYEIITGPVTVPPQASNIFTNLPQGTYNIRVNDVCGEGVVQTFTLNLFNPPNLTIDIPETEPTCRLPSCDSIEIDYIVTADEDTNIRYPLTVQITTFPPGGGTPVVQTQTVPSGNLSSLNLSSIIPFYYDQLYTYEIKIIDACGRVYIKNGSQESLELFADGTRTYINCRKGLRIGLCHYVAPFTVEFLSTPAGFNPATYNPLNLGPFNSGSTEYQSTSSSEMPSGIYTIKVTDACGRTKTFDVEVIRGEPKYEILESPDVCDPDHFLRIPLGGINGLHIVSAIFTASTADLGHPIPYNVTPLIVNGVLFMPIPAGTYTVEGVDICGFPFTYTFTTPPIAFEVKTIPDNITGCTGVGSMLITEEGGAMLTSIIITQAPATYNHALPYDVSFVILNGAAFGAVIHDLPPGTYTFEITDSCGRHFTRTDTITADVFLGPPAFFEKRGCGDNFDSIALVSQNGNLTTVIITAAPPSFPFTLPYDVSFNIASNGIFYMNSFPEGTYTFYTVDQCNHEATRTNFLTGYHQGGTIDVIPNCGSFDLNMNFSQNASTEIPPLYWLQKFNPLTNQWEHPLTGVVYPPNTVPTTANSFNLGNNAINYNIANTGTFRVLTSFIYYDNGLFTAAHCIHTIKTFDYDGQLRIVNAYAIPCVNGGSQVYIIAQGAAPLDYKITSMNGQPFLVNNGTSNSFAGLQPGTYNFRVQDVCGNIVNRLLDINTLQEPEIASSNLCIGLNGQLSVQPFSFLNYEWWKDNNTTTILSTTNVLSFIPFTNANAGTYHVRIFSTTLNSCVDRILTYTIAPNALPNAGIDANRIVCGDAVSVDLFTILGAPFNLGGTWQELTTSGMLVGNNWLPAGLLPGTYIFKYTVNGFCGSSDDSTVTITLNPAVEVPIINANTSFCAGEDLEFSIQSILNATYQWTGPNNFTSSLQNPTIPAATIVNAGTYNVTATIGQCHSSASVEIVGNPQPDYTYEKGCENGIFRIEIIPTPDSTFDPNTATYLWSGPNGFTSTSNPLVLTNQPIGNYSVVVTNVEGCSFPQDINVASTVCDFPNVITPNNDGTNDGLDLTNYDVELFQVFSRWGRLVYEENNYTNGWYGQNMHGGFLPDSTYYYFVRLRNGQEKHGWIFVGRG